MSERLDTSSAISSHATASAAKPRNRESVFKASAFAISGFRRPPIQRDPRRSQCSTALNGRVIGGLCLLIVFAVMSGCANPEHQFQLEEWGEGWTLKVQDIDGRTFKATWVKGDNRSLRLLNYHDAPQGDFTIINTLYLEVDDQGVVQRGMLKRTAVSNFSEREYAAGSAKWFRVLEGWCRIDAEGYGSLEVRCEGKYRFSGEVEPVDDLTITRPK